MIPLNTSLPRHKEFLFSRVVTLHHTGKEVHPIYLSHTTHLTSETIMNNIKNWRCTIT